MIMRPTYEMPIEMCDGRGNAHGVIDVQITYEVSGLRGVTVVDVLMLSSPGLGDVQVFVPAWEWLYVTAETWAEAHAGLLIRSALEVE